MELKKPPSDVEKHKAHFRKYYQLAAYTLLMERTHTKEKLFTRLEVKLGRWGVESDTSVGNVLSNLNRIAKLAPPKVMAALVYTVWNGWCTERRFQRRGCCRFGCGGNDELEHYAECHAVYSSQYGRRFILDKNMFFLNFVASEQVLLLAALVIYGSYRHFNASRAAETIGIVEESADAIHRYSLNCLASAPRLLAAVSPLLASPASLLPRPLLPPPSPPRS